MLVSRDLQLDVVETDAVVMSHYALMALTSDFSGWTVDRGQQYGFAFDAEEAF